MKKIVYIIIGITLLIACSEKRQYVETLNKAKTVMNKDACSALIILDSLGKHEADFDRHLKMQYRLHRMNAYNKLDTVFQSTKEAQELANYFETHGTSNEKMLAYYLLGRSFYDIHEVPMALNCYQIATEKADTTDEECNYHQLSRIYGQICNIFYNQNLFQQSLSYSHYEEINAWKAKDTLNALKSIAHRVGAYKQLMLTDSIISVLQRATSLLNKYGYRTISAGYMARLAAAYIEKGDYREAKKYINTYESLSGFFDKNGNIEHGRESYYYTKGLLYLATHQYDSAENTFRKELLQGKDFNNQNAASRGLAMLFQQKHMGDSAAKYALYSYEMNDSLYAHMATKEVEQMQGMYDYTRNMNIANHERERASKEHKKVIFILNILGLSLLIILYVAKDIYKKHKDEKKAYAQKLSELAKAQIDILKLRSIAEHTEELNQLIFEKESQIEQMSNDIKLYKEKLGIQKGTTESIIEESEIYQLLQKKARKAEELTNDEWHNVCMIASEVFPNFYKFISSKKLELNDKEFKTCILIRMFFTPKDIANLLGVSQAYITKIRNNMMPKLFGVKGNSKELDEKLMDYT